MPMFVEWIETQEGTCSRCAGWNTMTAATWARRFVTVGGREMVIRYCQAHAEAARTMVTAA